MLLEIEIRPRKGSRPVCSVCGKDGPGYDTLRVRRFEFVPLWGIAVFFLYAMRRVDCPRCGIKVERVPWADGKNHLTTTYAWFLARWARRLPWKEVADVFHTKWDHVFRSVKMAVAWLSGNPTNFIAKTYMQNIPLAAPSIGTTMTTRSLVPGLAPISNFWDTTPAAGENPNPEGLAEYTNRNFLSGVRLQRRDNERGYSHPP